MKKKSVNKAPSKTELDLQRQIDELKKEIEKLKRDKKEDNYPAPNLPWPFPWKEPKDDDNKPWWPTQPYKPPYRPRLPDYPTFPNKPNYPQIWCRLE